MNTLIIPCAGKSTRYPNMKPKWLLTHPDGELMIEKVIFNLDINKFDRVIITIVNQHNMNFDAELILNQIFRNKLKDKLEICVLDAFTSCQVETVIKTIEIMSITGSILIKDCDSLIEITDYKLVLNNNFVSGVNINNFKNENFKLKNKSFFKINKEKNIVEIKEKDIISTYISVGFYGFADAELFLNTYNILKNNYEGLELYISHIIQYLIINNRIKFNYLCVSDYIDWGTADDWYYTIKKHSTYIVDIDGVLVENVGKYGSRNWYNYNVELKNNLNKIKELSDNGAQIILLTSRDKKSIKFIEKIFNIYRIPIHAIITDCNHSCRIIINDFAFSNPYPSCKAINIPRNADINYYI